MVRAADGRPYVRHGDCTPGCGECCTFLTMFIPEFQAKHPEWREFFEMHGIPIVRDPVSGLPLAKVPLACKHLTSDGLCGIRDSRPLICRRFPEGPSDLIGLKRCTYRFEPVDDRPRE